MGFREYGLQKLGSVTTICFFHFDENLADLGELSVIAPVDISYVTKYIYVHIHAPIFHVTTTTRRFKKK